MPVRLTGMVSGMDTDTLIQQLVAAKRSKVDNIRGKKTKVEWQKEAWTDMNKKLYSFYTGSLSKLKSQATYKTKKATTTDDSKVDVKANANAVAGSHSIEVKSVASCTYLTSGKLKASEQGYQETYSKAVTDVNKSIDDMNNASDLVGKELKITIGEGDDKQELSYTFRTDSTIADVQEVFGENVEVTLKDGKLFIANKTATKVLGNDGEDTYEGGCDIKVSGDALEFLGVTGVDEVTLTAESSDSGSHAMEVGKAFTENATRTTSKITSSSRVTEAIGVSSGSTIDVMIGDVKKGTITINADTTMSQLAEQFRAYNLNATYDENQGRFFLSSKEAGEENAFTLEGSTDVLNALKLNKDAVLGENETEEDRASYVEGTSAEIIYNGAYIKSNTNEMTVNGLTITAKDIGKVNITVNNDTQAVYDTVKNFVTEYNKLLTDMYEKYSADSSRGYDPLTDEQKESMTEKEIENWEKKIKDSLLRRDETLNSLMSSMRNTMMKSVEVTLKDGTKTKLSLASIGIVTGNYTERGLLHIKGDADDPLYSAETNKLQEWLENDPEAVMQLFAGVENETTGQKEGLGNTLYSDFNTKMKSSSLSSALTFYNDKYMDTQIKSYKEKIDEMEDKLVDLEDSYYAKFAAMETALSKINTQSSYLTNMFGGGAV